MNKRIRSVIGGTGASKTISILLYLIAKAQSDKHKTVTSIVAETLPHLRKGAMRDFLNIMKTHGYYDDNRWNQTYYIYEFETGSIIEFFSVDSAGKSLGLKRDRLFMNEANRMDLDTFNQLEIRTKEFIIMDWNPVREFWYYTDFRHRDDVEEIVLTYKDNEALHPNIVKAIEKRRGNSDWWKVFGLGQLGEISGKIYTGWMELDDIPKEAELEVRGLDFGFTNDPTVIVDVYRYNGGYIIDERMYMKGMHNKNTADFILNLPQPNTLVIADGASPQNISEIGMYGINIIASNKKAGSVMSGISLIQSQNIYITKRSKNILREYRNYVFLEDSSGKLTNMPLPTDDHAMDAIRYAISYINPQYISDPISSDIYSKLIADDILYEDIGI